MTVSEVVDSIWIHQNTDPLRVFFPQVVGCLVSLLVMSPKLTIIMAVVVPSIIGAGSLIGSILRSLARKAQAQVDHQTSLCSMHVEVGSPTGVVF